MSGPGDIGPTFFWFRLKFNEFRLTWEPRRLISRGIKTIEVTATQTHNPSRVKSKTVGVADGEVIIGRLYPDTLYNMDVVASGDGIVGLTYRTSLRTWPTAPSLMLPPRGKTVSSRQIKLRWIEPTYPNGVLKPYHVTCYAGVSGNAPISVFTKLNTTTGIILGNLQPNTAYRCRVEASTYPARGQDPKECTTQSDFSPPIWTKPADTMRAKYNHLQVIHGFRQLFIRAYAHDNLRENKRRPSFRAE
ncbi:Usherin [Taenia solium]|eukprot:TsM_000742100 transcript=TsM_000742100 gene=TsM_000742100